MTKPQSLFFGKIIFFDGREYHPCTPEPDIDMGVDTGNVSGIDLIGGAMTIKEFVAKLKESEGATATERSETLRELVEVSELDMDTIVRMSKALHDPENR